MAATSGSFHGLDGGTFFHYLLIKLWQSVTCEVCCVLSEHEVKAWVILCQQQIIDHTFRVNEPEWRARTSAADHSVRQLTTSFQHFRKPV